MTLIEFISVATVPISLLMTVAVVFIGVALATPEGRVDTMDFIQRKDFGSTRFSSLAGLWGLYFQRLFGNRIFAKRQLLTIPIYTIIVSGIFFSIWIAYLYIFKNPSHSFNANLPPYFMQSIKDFYHEGVIAAILIDFITIQLTKAAINTGRKYGYYSVRFFFRFSIAIVLAYFVFSISVFYFRVEDMVRLYTEIVPYDPLPIIPYTPLKNIASSLNLFYPQTSIYITSRGGMTTYFMPEPLIFYCAVAGQLSLVSITLGYQIATGLNGLKNLCLGFVKQVGTPKANGYSVISFILLGLVSVPLLLLSILVMVSHK